MWHTFLCTRITAENLTHNEICTENVKNVEKWPFLALKLVISLWEKISQQNAQSKKFLESHAMVACKILGKVSRLIFEISKKNAQICHVPIVLRKMFFAFSFVRDSTLTKPHSLFSGTTTKVLGLCLVS